MSWKCEKCGQKLKGREKYCPECAQKAVYHCKSCGKIMDNGKDAFCPLCSIGRKEKREDLLKKAGGAVGAAGAFAIGIVTRGKFGGGKS